MSFAPGWRKFAKTGRVGGDWRGLIQSDTYSNTGRTVMDRGQIGTVVYRSPGGASNLRLVGVTRDSTGVALASCRVDLCQSNVIKQSVTSDGSGNYTFLGVGSGPFFVVAYKVGSPDVAGTTVNTLQPENY